MSGWEDTVRGESSYRSVSLRLEALERLRAAQAWVSGDRGRVATISETVEALVGFYEARSRD